MKTKFDPKSVRIAKPAPMDKNNGALHAYVTLCVAADMERDGMWMFAKVLDAWARKLVMEHGVLPEGTYIPPDVWDAVYGGIVESVKEVAEGLAPKN